MSTKSQIDDPLNLLPQSNNDYNQSNTWYDPTVKILPHFTADTSTWMKDPLIKKILQCILFYWKNVKKMPTKSPNELLIQPVKGW